MRILAGDEANMLKGEDSYEELATRLRACDSSTFNAGSADDHTTDVYDDETEVTDDGTKDGKFVKGIKEKKAHRQNSTAKLGGSVHKAKKGKDTSSKPDEDEVSAPSSLDDSKAGASNRSSFSKSKTSGGAKKANRSGVEEHDMSSQKVGKPCQTNAIFILDGSGSLRLRFQRQLQMSVNLVDALPPAPLKTHFSILKFGGANKTRLILPLK